MALGQAIGGQPVLDTLSIAHLLLTAAEDHLRGAGRLLAADETVMFADKILVRAGVEACARSFWLLDLAVGARQRVTRGLTVRLADLTLQLKLASADDEAELRERRSALIERARGATLHVHSRKGRPPAVEEEMPSATELMRKLFGNSPEDELDLGRFAQIWLSTFVHSFTPGLLSVRIFRDREFEHHSVGRVSVALGSSSTDVNHYLALAALGAVTALNRYLNYCGLDGDSWVRTVINAAATVRSVIGGTVE